MIKPLLKDYKKPQRLSAYPLGTSFEAGHLVSENSGWRTQKPVYNHESCTQCKQCYLYCPEGVINFMDKNINIDYQFCKGCGICAKICKKSSIRMEVENG